MIEELDFKYEFKENAIYCGDNLKILLQFPSECVDLIYIDPPFFSDSNYELLWNDGYEIRAYEDRWKGGIDVYVDWMKPRLEELYRILKSNGSFYLHCDYHANYKLRNELEKIFKKENFRREIIWCYNSVSGFKTRAKNWIRNHDSIYYYVKNNEYIFNKQYFPYKERYIEDTFSIRDENGNITYQKDKNGIIYKDYSDGRYYLREGIPMDDVWNDITSFQTRTRAKEYLKYETQKPEKLLKRIILSSSNEGDVILDAFCGGGTTLAVAKKLNRKYIGIDVSPLACDVTAKRINYDKLKIIGMKYKIKELKEMDPFTFQYWTVQRIGGIPNPRKTGDKGIDGIIPDTEYGKNIPVEVKQHKIGRPDVDKFNTSITRKGKKAGYMIGFDFTRDAYEEMARAKNEEELDIIPIRVKDLFKNAPKDYKIIIKDENMF